MKKILYYLKPYIPRMSLGFLVKFTGTIMDLFIPWILAYVIDDVIPLNNISIILVWGFIMFVCSFFAVSFNIIANRMASRVARDTTRRLRHDLFCKILYLSCKQIDTFTIPSLVSRMTTDTYNIHQAVGMIQRLGVRAPILLIGGIIVTLTLEPVLTLVLIATLPFLAALVYCVSKKGIPLYTELQNSVDGLVRTVRENITGVRVIKALSKGDYENQRFHKVNSAVVAKEKKAGTTMAIINPMMNLLLNLGLVGIIILGAYRVNLGVTKPGKIVAFLSYFTIILNAMMSITRMFVNISRASASAERIALILDTPEDITVQPFEKTKSDYHIEFNHVNFSYDKKENNLTDINFKLKRGESLGIIGSTGSGKSTVINLLIRFYDIDSGEIKINGQNIKSIDKNLLRQKFGIVFQNDILFADTLRENINFGRDLSDDDIKNAISYAQAEEFINNLKNGLDYQLDVKGANLSGGQKQRVLISRALAKKPEILILDDSSSALDYKTDALLRNEINRNFHDTTSIIVAQRVSSIMNLDHIMVLEDGKIIGYGTHDELIKNCDIYKEISKSQMGGENSGSI